MENFKYNNKSFIMPTSAFLYVFFCLSVKVRSLWYVPSYHPILILV